MANENQPISSVASMPRWTARPGRHRPPAGPRQPQPDHQEGLDDQGAVGQQGRDRHRRGEREGHDEPLQVLELHRLARRRCRPASWCRAAWPAPRTGRGRRPAPAAAAAPRARAARSPRRRASSDQHSPAGISATKIASSRSSRSPLLRTYTSRRCRTISRSATATEATRVCQPTSSASAARPSSAQAPYGEETPAASTSPRCRRRPRRSGPSSDEEGLRVGQQRHRPAEHQQRAGDPERGHRRGVDRVERPRAAQRPRSREVQACRSRSCRSSVGLCESPGATASRKVRVSTTRVTSPPACRATQRAVGSHSAA